MSDLYKVASIRQNSDILLLTSNMIPPTIPGVKYSIAKAFSVCKDLHRQPVVHSPSL